MHSTTAHALIAPHMTGNSGKASFPVTERDFKIHTVDTAARLIFGQQWKDQDTPKINELVNKIYEVAEMDLLTTGLGEGNSQEMESRWWPFYAWIEDLK